MYLSEIEAIPILAAKVVFTFHNALDRHRDLVGCLLYEGTAIDDKGFEVVFANEQECVLMVLAYEEGDRAWRMRMSMMDRDTRAERECLVYKVHKSTLELVLARGTGVAKHMLKDLLRYYKVVYVQRGCVDG